MHHKNLPLGAWISQALEIAEDTLGDLSSLSFYGDHTMVADRCEGVVAYSNEQVIVQLCDMTVTLTGSRLKLSTFRFGRISVSGEITGMTIDKKRGKSS